MPQGIIKNIEIEGLFGRYDHVLPKGGSLHSPTILYGDNGVGKSTILNMVFHLLSSAGDRGHRSALRRISFKKITVQLSNGSTLTAQKETEPNDELLILQVLKAGVLVAEWRHSDRRRDLRYEDYEMVLRDLDYRDIEQTDRIKALMERNLSLRRLEGPKNDSVRRGEREYLEALEAATPSVFYLNADRKLDSDSVTDPSEEIELRQAIMTREMKRATDILQASRAISLKQALSTASRFINRQAVIRANQGTESVHSVYEKLVQQLSSDYRSSDEALKQHEIDSIMVDLDRIERETQDFSNYQLAVPLKMDKFRRALSRRADGSQFSAKLIKPYLDSLSGRLDAIRPIYSVIDGFVKIINDFLSRKRISFSISQGFIIYDDIENKLDASALSSGEQQLLLIFSYVLAARDKPSVFIIDEPEISLNVKWQRRMVDSLLQVAQGSNIQFILASHSVELITQHIEHVVEVA